MTLLRINATAEGLRLHQQARAPWPSITRALRGTGPVVIMVHGFRFAPGAGQNCPHQHILSAAQTPLHPKAISWPRALGFCDQAGAPGLGIAFGWHARGTLWRAFDEAANAGLALASLINQIHLVAPHRPLHLIGHSMGARVILSALPHAQANSLSRILLLAPAEFRQTAQAALRSPAGRSAEIFNISSRENDLFDMLIEALIPTPDSTPDRIIGSTPPDTSNLLSIRLDDPGTLRALSDRAIHIAPRQRRICHWSSYLRPGVFDLYRALLFAPQQHPLSVLKADLPAHPRPANRPFRPVALIKPTLPLSDKAPS